MNITQRDVQVIVVMSLAVISMSFIFPALGIGGEEVQDNDIPSLEMNSSRFDISGDIPAAPGSPNTGELVWKDSRDDQLNQVWLRGDTSGGVEMALLPPINGTRPLQVTISEWDSGNVVYNERINFTDTGQEEIFVNESLGYEMTFESLEVNDTAGDYTIRYEVVAQVVDSGWLSGVPVLGGAVEATQATAATLGWFIELAMWAITYVFDLIANAVGLTADVGIYLVSLINWLITSYTGIIASTAGWVSVFVALPGILLGTVLAKVVAVGIALLPTT